MPQLYIIFEHATGYALFRTTEFEEIAAFLPQVRSSILDVSKFRSHVYLVSYQAFKTKSDAVNNLNDIAKGVLPKQLQLFIENNVPKTKKSKQAVVLGIQDPDLGNAISESLGITCATSGVILEVIRGIRKHFHKLVKGFSDEAFTACAQRSLGHHYSRSRVNFDQTKTDIMISGILKLIDQLKSNVQKNGLRLREWYSVHFPELRSIVSELAAYAKCVNVLGDRNNLPADINEQLTSVLKNSTQVDDILKATKNSMGMDISETDLENIKAFTNYVFSLMDRLQDTENYLKSKMHQVAPNLSKISGEMVGAQLISRAGGLMNLAKLPSTTVQVLGAQKSLFRVKPTYDSSKFGILSECEAIKRTKKLSKKLNIGRLLANKCALACRTDCFVGKNTNTFCQLWNEEIEKRIKFYDKSSKWKNVDEDIPDKDIITETNKTVAVVENTSNETTKSMTHVGLNGDLDADETCPPCDDGKGSTEKKKRVTKRKSNVQSSEVLNSEECDENAIEANESILPGRKRLRSSRNIKCKAIE
ncbi:nucleolar protein 56-like isoform X2 [Uloborus diversus]|uniref:nucleolar protein 56-like isoform X2 n=1 Tax=Uloborus diversus TaxID=327109 RepID=UPI00240A531B|nr:nucleolar protein 56-like isoform X2 [Uloborus diversus]